LTTGNFEDKIERFEGEIILHEENEEGVRILEDPQV